VFACVDWAAAVAALKTGRVGCSSSGQRVLVLAASLADGVPVDLGDPLTGLEQATAALVGDGIAHAVGHRRYVRMLGDGTAW
jgi:hypothetical protein